MRFIFITKDSITNILAGDKEAGMTNSSFPERLQQLRERKRVSRRVLSELCGLSKSAISRYERGERQPRLDEATELAEFFGVSLDWLCGRSENKII